MDWNLAIEKNREALKRILAALAAMAGLAGTAPTSPLCGLRGRSSDRASDSIVGREGRGDCEAIGVPGKIREASGGGSDPAMTPTRRSDDRRPPHKGEVGSEVRPTLPRHLHRATLRLLRPAEAAARRLVIVAACGIVVTLPPQRPRKPKPDPKAAHAVLRSLGIAVVLPHNVPHQREAELQRTPARKIALPLLDPLRIPKPLSLSKGRPRYVPPHAAPRILSFDGARPHRLPPPSPDDPVDATRLNLRLAALAAALDDLPKQARRFARWKARRAAGPIHRPESPSPLRGGVRGGGHRFVRLSPLRPGRPPGWRRKPVHEAHEVLNEIHGLALWALERPDTS